jgi:hypothetical protein
MKVARSTLQRAIYNRNDQGRAGPPTVMTMDEEKELLEVSYLAVLCSKVFYQFISFYFLASEGL